MPLSNLQIPPINTIDILSVAGVFNYQFEMEENQTAKLNWAQFLYTASAVVGTRRPLLTITDETGALVVSVTYYQTLAANGSAQVLYAQGNTIVPVSVVGVNTAIPPDLYVRNDWTLGITSFPFISAADAFSGFFQTTGRHNSEAPN